MAGKYRLSRLRLTKRVFAVYSDETRDWLAEDSFFAEKLAVRDSAKAEIRSAGERTGRRLREGIEKEANHGHFVAIPSNRLSVN
jgi:hypothetical protein